MDSHKDYSKFSVCIIGAGCSGMLAANLLKELGFKVKLIEASDSPCGRIRGLKNFCQKEIELGGEEIHGDKTIYYRLAKEAGAKIFGYWEENTFYSNYQGEFNDIDSLAEKHKNLKIVWDLFEESSYDHKLDYPDIPTNEYLRKIGIPGDLDFLANAMLAVECGTDLDRLSIGGFSSICKKWQAGEENFLISGMSHTDILKKVFRNILEDISLNRPVTSIQSNQDSVLIEDASGKTEQFDLAIVTVPVTQVKKIKFIPELSPEKKNAFAKIDLDNVAKLILKFKKPFWPENCSWLLLPGSINVYWPVTQGEKACEHLLTGMTAGQQTRDLNELFKESKEKFISKIISELEASTKTKISEDLIDWLWFDWKNVPFIEGGYSFPTVGEGESRDIMRAPIEKKVFFAGEAYARNGHIGTIHGALESAQEAVDTLVSIVSEKISFEKK